MIIDDANNKNLPGSIEIATNEETKTRGDKKNNLGYEYNRTLRSHKSKKQNICVVDGGVVGVCTPHEGAPFSRGMFVTSSSSSARWLQRQLLHLDTKQPTKYWRRR